MHLKKVMSKKRFCTLHRRLSPENFRFFEITFLGAFCHYGKIAFLESTQKDEFFYTPVGLIQSQKLPCIYTVVQ
jgi:hypothetical protein